jgi:hypothetical protein
MKMINATKTIKMLSMYAGIVSRAMKAKKKSIGKVNIAGIVLLTILTPPPVYPGYKRNTQD